jgi:hypothetical protein
MYGTIGIADKNSCEVAQPCAFPAQVGIGWPGASRRDLALTASPKLQPATSINQNSLSNRLLVDMTMQTKAA